MLFLLYRSSGLEEKVETRGQSVIRYWSNVCVCTIPCWVSDLEVNIIQASYAVLDSSSLEKGHKNGGRIIIDDDLDGVWSSDISIKNGLRFYFLSVADPEAVQRARLNPLSAPRF